MYTSYRIDAIWIGESDGMYTVEASIDGEEIHWTSRDGITWYDHDSDSFPVGKIWDGATITMHGGPMDGQIA